MAAARSFPPKITVTGVPQRFTVSSFISDLKGPGKAGDSGKYWMARVLKDGVEHTWFINEPEREILIEDEIRVGDVIEVWREGTGEFDARNRAITTVLVALVARGAEPPKTAAVRTKANTNAAAGPRIGEVRTSTGWTTQYRANPDLEIVPGSHGVQAEIFARLCGGVGDELAAVAKQKVEVMTGGPVAGKSALEIAGACQAAFATLVISWKDLGYPATPGESVRRAAVEPATAKWE